MLSLVIQDARIAIRAALRKPLLPITMILVLSLGIGASSALFSVAHALLLKPLPFPESERIVQVRRLYKGEVGRAVSIPLFLHLRERETTLESLAAHQILPVGMNLIQAGAGIPERINGIRVTREFFAVFGTPPARGRGFLLEEDRPGGPAVVVLSDGLWRRRFGADPALLGKAIVLNNLPHTVVGIMPPAFQYPPMADFWAPLALPSTSTDPANMMIAVGRLRPTVPLAAAREDVKAAHARIKADFPKIKPGDGLLLTPLREVLIGDTRQTILLLFGAVVLLLLIACANLGNIQLTRVAVRQSEFALRAAIGAGRGNLIRLILIEATVLSLASGLLGLVFGQSSRFLLQTFSPAGMPLAQQVALDPLAILFTFVLALMAGCLFGIGPALTFSRTEVAKALKECSTRTSGGPDSSRLRSILVMTEIAVSCMLLVGAALFAQSYIRLLHTDLGFDPKNVLTAQISLSEVRYKQKADVINFYDGLLTRLNSIPGVEHAGLVTSLPLEIGPDLPYNVDTGGDPDRPTGSAQYRAVSPGYFKAMGIRLKRGRDFTIQDTTTAAGVAVVNECLARKFWRDGDPIGKQITIGRVMGPAWADRGPRTIVGVVADIRETSPELPASDGIFVPYPQIPPALAGLLISEIPTRIALRANSSMDITQALQRAALAADPTQAVAAVKPMEDIVRQATARRQLQMALMVGFGLTSLILAALGVYGVTASFVAQQTKEIGIRLALGAPPSAVVGAVTRRGLALTATGVLAGGGAAAACAPLLRAFVYQTSVFDVWTFVSVIFLLLAVAAGATLIPGIRASRISPVTALHGN